MSLPKTMSIDHSETGTTAAITVVSESKKSEKLDRHATFVSSSEHTSKY